MKSKRNPFATALTRNSLLAATLAFTFALPSADAVTRYWDTNSTVAGAGDTPSGIWGVGVADTFWSTSATGTAATTAATTTPIDDLYFSAGTDAVNAYTVTVDATRSARVLVIEEGTPTFSGGVINLGYNGGFTVQATAGNPVVSSGITVNGHQTFNTGADRTLTLNTGSFTRANAATFNVAGAGILNSTLTGLDANNSAGILGAWATFGTGTATRYATITSGTIGGHSGTAAATAADLTDTTGLVNYDLATAEGTVPASVSASTIRYTGPVGTTAPGASGFSVNGLMNAGTGTWTIGSDTLTIGDAQELVVNTVSGNISISSIIDDNNLVSPSALTKTGAFRLILSGVNTYEGTTTVNAGTLDVGTIANGSLGSGGLHLVGGSILQGNGTLTRTLGSNLTPTTGQVAGGNGGFAARGGQLTVDFGGTLAISGTTFSNRFGDNFVFGSATADSLVKVVSPINLNGSTRNFTVNSGVGGDSAELSGAILASTAGIIKNGAGLLVLSAVNLYTGTTTITGGTLQVGTLADAGDSLGDGGLIITGNSVLQANGNFFRPFNATPVAGTPTVTAGQVAGGSGGFAAKGGTLTVNFGGAAAAVFLSGATVNNRFGDNFVFGSPTADSPVIVQNPINLNGSTRIITVNSGIGGDSAEFTGIITASAVVGITKNGTGLLILSGDNNYTGVTTINAGTLRANHANALGTNAGITTIASAAGALALSGNISVPENITINARNTGDQLVNTSGDNSLTGILTWFTGGTSYGVRSDAGKLTISSPLTPAGGSKTLNLSGNGAIEFSAAIGNTDTGILSVTKNGGGTLTLSGTNTYTGPTTVNAGTLVLTSNTTISDLSSLSIDKANGAVVNLPNATTDVVAALIIDGVTQLDGTYDAANTDGAITGLGKIQVGAGADDYETWVATFGPTFTDTAAGSDPDADGLLNQQEYAYGLSPISGSSSNPIVANLNKTTGKFTYTRRSLALTELDYTVSTSPNLVNWTADAGATENIISDISGVETVEITLSATLPLSESKLFVRVSAE